MALVTPTAYAKQKGLARQTMHEALDAGRIPFIRDARGRRMVDPAVADLAYARLTDHSHSLSGKGNAGSDVVGEERGAWVAAKQRTEDIRAALLEIELAELRGQILRKDRVASVLGTLFTTLREEMLNFAVRTAPTIRAQKNDAEAIRVAEKAIRDAMRHAGALPEILS